MSTLNARSEDGNRELRASLDMSEDHASSGDSSLDDLDRLVPLRDAATALAISTRTIERWVDAGRFPAPIKIGRKRAYAKSELVRLIEKAKRGQL